MEVKRDNPYNIKQDDCCYYCDKKVRKTTLTACAGVYYRGKYIYCGHVWCRKCSKNKPDYIHVYWLDGGNYAHPFCPECNLDAKYPLDLDYILEQRKLQLESQAMDDEDAFDLIDSWIDEPREYVVGKSNTPKSWLVPDLLYK